MKKITLTTVCAAMAASALAAEPRPVRGMYFATHFGNWYEKASERELADYLRELKYWDCNAVSVWFDMHDFTGMDDPAAAPRVKLIKTIFRLCAENGMRRELVMLANEGFKNSPAELRADWRCGQNGYRVSPGGHYHVEICPSKPGGMEQLLASRKAMFDAFADTPPDFVEPGPYDQGGCTCSNCAPWGANGYLRCSKQVAALARKTFPGVGVGLSTWRFDAFGPNLGELDGLWAQRDDVRQWASRLRCDQGHLGWFESHPVLPFLPMTEISMGGMLPWGGFGANPQPKMLEDVARANPAMVGTMPYSEGIYEDMNKVIGLALLSGRAATAREAIMLYAARYFGQGTGEAVADAAALLEVNQYHDALVVQDGKEFSFYSLGPVDPKRPWQLEAKLKKLDAQRAARAVELLRGAEGKMTVEAKKAWRWRILMLRAEIDDALAKDATLDALAAKFDELAEIYHVGADTLPCLVPPSRKYLRPGPDVLRHGAF